MTTINRRHFLGAAGGVAATTLLPTARARANSPGKLVFVGWGGSYQDAQRKAHLDPFKAKRGIEITEIPGGPRLAKLKAQVEANNVEWNIIDLEWSDMLRAGRAGLLEPIDTSVVDMSKIVPEGRNEFGVMNCYYSMVFGRNTNHFPADKPGPVGWKGFWDVANFPGPRCLKDTPKGALEGALIADGVALADLYPLDIDRAFRKLTELKPHITNWYSGAAQVVQLLSSGEVVLASTSHNRLEAAIADSAPIAVDWTDGRLDSDFWCVPRGAPHKALAMEFIASAIQADQQAEMARLTSLGPTNPDAIALLNADELKGLPSTEERMKGQFWTNNEWWLDNEEKIQRQWELWKLS